MTEDGGESIDTGPAMYQVMFIVGLLFLFAILMVLIVNRSLSADLVSDENTNRLMIAESIRYCFLKEVEGRVYYDTITLTKFNEDRLVECIPDDMAEVKLFEGDNLVKAIRTPGGRSEKLIQYIINVDGSNKIHLMSVGLR